MIVFDKRVLQDRQRPKLCIELEGWRYSSVSEASVKQCCLLVAIIALNMEYELPIIFKPQTTEGRVRSEVSTAVTMKNAVFCDIKTRSYLTGDTLLLCYRAQSVNVV
jgi:hypothetical protein